MSSRRDKCPLSFAPGQSPAGQSPAGQEAGLQPSSHFAQLFHIKFPHTIQDVWNSCLGNRRGRPHHGCGLGFSCSPGGNLLLPFYLLAVGFWVINMTTEGKPGLPAPVWVLLSHSPALIHEERQLSSLMGLPLWGLEQLIIIQKFYAKEIHTQLIKVWLLLLNTIKITLYAPKERHIHNHVRDTIV